MKILVTSTGETLTSPFDFRFGRAAKFILFDTISGQYESIDNAQSMDTPQGAGIQGAETVARLGPQCVITGNCGPKAFRVLSAAGITVFITNAITVADAIERFRAGRLVAALSAEV